LSEAGCAAPGTPDDSVCRAPDAGAKQSRSHRKTGIPTVRVFFKILLLIARAGGGLRLRENYTSLALRFRTAAPPGL
jgi:hypothetical protein